MSPDPNSPTPTNADGSHVVSNRAWRIRALGQELVDDTKGTLDQAVKILDNINIGFPGFSIAAAPLFVAHDSTKGQASLYVSAAIKAINSWQDGLDTIARVWDRAESNSKVPPTK
jgi:hypothetical protein